jgi:hypothetical protein
MLTAVLSSRNSIRQCNLAGERQLPKAAISFTRALTEHNIAWVRVSSWHAVSSHNDLV